MMSSNIIVCYKCSFRMISGLRNGDVPLAEASEGFSSTDGYGQGHVSGGSPMAGSGNAQHINRCSICGNFMTPAETMAGMQKHAGCEAKSLQSGYGEKGGHGHGGVPNYGQTASVPIVTDRFGKKLVLAPSGPSFDVNDSVSGSFMKVKLAPGGSYVVQRSDGSVVMLQETGAAKEVARMVGLPGRGSFVDTIGSELDKLRSAENPFKITLMLSTKGKGWLVDEEGNIVRSHTS